jgi:hypothetical protein
VELSMQESVVNLVRVGLREHYNNSSCSL